MTNLSENNAIRSEFAVLQGAFLNKGELTIEERRLRLKALLNCLYQHEQAIAAALHRDFGNRSHYETRMNEIFPLSLAIKQAIKSIPRWAEKRKQKVSWLFKPSKAYLLPRAKGVVGVISPWNYPLLLCLSPLVQAISAGNRVMLKPSGRTIYTTQIIQQICKQVFKPEEVQVVTPNASGAGNFAELPFDHLIFTGSNAVAKTIMQQASTNLTPLTLELGGKNPALVITDYSIELAARSIARGKMMNAGQACIAPDYAYVPKTRITDFVNAYCQAVQDFYPQGLEDSALTSVRDANDRQRIRNYLQDAETKGAKIIYPLGNSGSHKRNKDQIPPAIILGCTNEMLVMQEELFGPLLPVLAYTDIEGCLERINQQSQPLAIYLFSNLDSARQKVQCGTSSGALCINETLIHFAQENLPFGGIGQSGMGAYHGQTGFDSLSHLKPVYVHSRFNSTKALYPPFKPQLLKMLRFVEHFV